MIVSLPKGSDVAPRRLLRGGLIAVAGSALLAVSAHVAVPFWPVPLTLQTLAVLLIGAAAGPRLGVAVVLAYIVEGIVGLPVFAGGLGAGVLLGPTGGYLAGYVGAAALAGAAADAGWLGRPRSALLAFAAADALVFVFGLARLATLFGLTKAVAVGLTPFLLGESIKIMLAVALVTLPRRVITR